MGDTKVLPGERYPNVPRGRILVAIAAIVLCIPMYTIYSGHGPIPGHVVAPASNQPAG